MKRNINAGISMLIIIMTIMTTLPAMAQPQGKQGPPPIPTEDQINKMLLDLSKELSLTEAQDKRVSDIYFSHFEEAQAKMEKNKNSKGPNREEMEKHRADFIKEVKAELTPKQQKQYDAYLKEHQNMRQGTGKPQR